METITISPKFQIVIPKAIRDLLGLRPGQKVQAIASPALCTKATSTSGRVAPGAASGSPGAVGPSASGMQRKALRTGKRVTEPGNRRPFLRQDPPRSGMDVRA